ncbi:MAG TPA: hypothetical protein IAB68_01840 [Candidatus Aphodocola excrementigallinarum]|uniref:DUF1307 domain-containing protein n=1 Tax=Candidatus Aphodocola excrementigallinarum TaxID=2840670 RepID=A0A9D1LHK4_9FIRM|nr:hypothetical protein [Candidatus Aphodocola excrementigallinarum]
MKKVLMSLLAISLAFILTGCGNDTLTCTMSESEDGMQTSQELKVNFSKDEVSKVNLKMDFTVGDEYSDYMSFYKNLLESQFEDVTDNGGKVDVTQEGNTLKLDLSIDMNDLSEEQKTNLDLSGTKESVRSQLEEEGYTCK